MSHATPGSPLAASLSGDGVALPTLLARRTVTWHIERTACSCFELCQRCSSGMLQRHARAFRNGAGRGCVPDNYRGRKCRAVQLRRCICGIAARGNRGGRAEAGAARLIQPRERRRLRRRLMGNCWKAERAIIAVGITMAPEARAAWPGEGVSRDQTSRWTSPMCPPLPWRPLCLSSLPAAIVKGAQFVRECAQCEPPAWRNCMPSWQCC